MEIKIRAERLSDHVFRLSLPDRTVEIDSMTTLEKLLGPYYVSGQSYEKFESELLSTGHASVHVNIGKFCQLL